MLEGKLGKATRTGNEAYDARSRNYVAYGTLQPGEKTYNRIFGRNGFPIPARNIPVTIPNARIYYDDRGWPVMVQGGREQVKGTLLDLTNYTEEQLRRLFTRLDTMELEVGFKHADVEVKDEKGRSYPAWTYDQDLRPEVVDGLTPIEDGDWKASRERRSL